MKKIINKKVIHDEVKNITNIVITFGCLVLGAFLMSLLYPSGVMWIIIGSAVFLIIAPLLILVILIWDRNKDVSVFKKNNFFIVKKSVSSIERTSSDVTDTGTVYPRYLYKFGKYGSIILEEGTDISWNSTESVFYLLIWGEKKIIKRVYSCKQWEVDENEFVKEDEIYRPKESQSN